jgi:Lon protease-like protein
MDTGGASTQVVGVFALPNTVLFPRVVLPLHVFEQRYRAMTADALASDRQFAVALLRPGWEKDYHDKPAIHPVVCIGRILTHEKLPDGKYNLLLQGHTRARIVTELYDHRYRVAEVETLKETPVLEIDLEQQRRLMLRLFEETPLSSLAASGSFRQLLRSLVPTPHLADLLAFNFLEDVELKQSLLEEADVRTRVGRIVAAIQAIAPTIRSGLRGYPTTPGLN